MRRGFTLLEVLFVVVIAAAVALSAAATLGAAHDEAQVRAILDAAVDLDRLARLHARRAGPVVLRVAADGASLLARPEGSERVLARRDVPRGISIELVIGGRCPDLRIDRTGASRDYELRMSRGGVARIRRICGETGFVMAEEGAR